MSSISLRRSARTWATSGLLAMAATSAWAQNTPAMPENWGVRQLDNGTLYKPTDLPKGSLINLWAPAPLPVGEVDAQQAVVQVKQQYGLSGLKPSGPPQCQEAEVNQGSVTQQCRIEVEGRPTVTAQYVMMPVRNGKAYFMRVLAAGDPALLAPYKAGITTAIKIETQRWASDR